MRTSKGLEIWGVLGARLLPAIACGTALLAGGCDATVAEEGPETAEGAEYLTNAPRWKVLDIRYEVQKTGYWCGPAATRIALSARTAPPSQSELAAQLGTTVNGTDWIGQITRVLNARGGGPYATMEMPADPPTPGQKAAFWDDIVRNIDNNFPIVANIVAPPNNHPPGYPNTTIYHYFTIIGYNPDTRQVYIADPANFGGNSFYWLTFEQLSRLVPPKGYSAIPDAAIGTRCPGTTGVATGAIEIKYREVGGCGSVLGRPLGREVATPDGIGRYSVFERGSIYWTPKTGAQEVHGQIRDAWASLGWEAGALGYPIGSEVVTPDKVGRYNVFERGSIYWTPSTGAHAVYGRIRDAWAGAGWEAGRLGYPTSDEYAVPEGRKSDFQRGSIVWKAANDTTTVTVR